MSLSLNTIYSDSPPYFELSVIFLLRSLTHTRAYVSTMSEKKGSNETAEVLDLCIIGSGISGINTAYRAQAAFPNIKYAVFEARTEIGGT